MPEKSTAAPEIPQPPDAEKAVRETFAKVMDQTGILQMAKAAQEAQEFAKKTLAHQKWVENTLVLICKRLGITGKE